MRIYKRGLELFVEYYGKSLDEILEERRQDLASSNPMMRAQLSKKDLEEYKRIIEENNNH